MSERVVMVTGAAGGVGSATVSRFLDGGWRVVGVDIAQQTCGPLRSAGAPWMPQRRVGNVSTR